MRVFALRATTKDLTSESDIAIITEDGEIFDIVNIKKECTKGKNGKGEVVDVHPCNLVIVIKSRKPKEKKAGYISKSVHV